MKRFFLPFVVLLLSSLCLVSAVTVYVDRTAMINLNTVLSCSGVPSSSFGNDGDYCIDSSVSKIYGPKASGSWPNGVSLVGSAGSPDAHGATGPSGGVYSWVSKTAAYTVESTDNSKAFLLSGNFTFTVGPTSGYASPFNIMVMNSPSSKRGQAIAIDGIPNFFLFPGQSFTLSVDAGGVWRTFPQTPARWNAPVGTVFYVNPRGSDTTNDGLATGSANAFATINHAISFVKQYVDGGATPITLRLDHGTYTESVINAGDLPNGGGQIALVGDSSSPRSVIIRAPSGQSAFTVDDHAVSILQHLEIDCNGTDGRGVVALQFSVLDLDHVTFGPCNNQSMVIASNNGLINFTGPITISGSALNFLYAYGSGSVVNMAGVPITFSTPVTITYFLQAVGQSSIQVGGATFVNPGNLTGIKWLAADMALIVRHGATIPGTTDGTPTAGSLSSDGAYVH